MKYLILCAICLMGCLSNPDKPASIDGRYQSEFIDGPPIDSGVISFSKNLRKDMLVLHGDSIQYFVCTYEIPLQNGVPTNDTLREVQFSGGRFSISKDSIDIVFSSYGRTGDLMRGRIFVDTMAFQLEGNSGKIRTKFETYPDRIKLEFNGETKNHLVDFIKVNRLLL